ncbi:MAG: hypothetical protein HN742_21765 [Lentisphaerae bacterium]|nr:hypothetical protein [Lentisphaerota bacterium]MBT4818641.1 hypothetical protein [Lentisphaerota bacterium]MBT5607090.1 hypothetical protein [Lentisphaerota bacterium]MBT7057197.1 hypothetical protein [Lentisphaerota bacterium]MBT7844520.1 hypothetical protein [Lentisphaerota bacterium]
MGNEDTAPVGQGDYVVAEGDCITSIAAAHGFFWKQVWNHPDNAELKRVREHPNMLLPGDRVTIPEKEEKTVDIAAEKRSRFRRKGIPAVLRLEFRAFGNPRKNEPYELEADGAILQKGKLDSNGQLECPIPPGTAKVIVYLGDERTPHEVELGKVPPIDAISGIQVRLNNLDLPCGPPDGTLNEYTIAAMHRFQRKYGLERKDEPDDAFRNKLKQIHGS